MTKRDVRLIVRIESGNSFGDPYNNLSTEVVYFNADEQRWDNCSGYSVPEELRGYDDLTVRTQGDKYDATFSLYGGKPQYHKPYKVELEDAKLMVSTLTRIMRRLEKLQAEFGYPQTVGDQIIRFAKALGITNGRPFLMYLPESPSRDNQGYVSFDADGLKSRLRQSEQDFAKKFNIAPRES